MVEVCGIFPFTVRTILERHSAVVRDFAEALASSGPSAAADWALRFRRSDAPETFVAEALVWKLLHESGCRPQYCGRAPAHARPDFSCSSTVEARFEVEVTCLTFDRQSARTGLPGDPTDEPIAFQYDAAKIRDVISAKADQLRSLGRPLIVVVTSFHPSAGDIIFSRIGIEECMTGVPRVPVVIPGSGKALSTPSTTTTLDEAIFVRATNSGAEAVRKHISAVLFVGIGAIHALVMGAVHPEPTFPIDHRLLGAIPIAHIDPWPLTKKIDVRWTGDPSRPASWEHGHPSHLPPRRCR